MLRANPLLHALAAGIVAITLVPAAMAQTRTWVSGHGDDANPCSVTAPCKTFAGALSHTSPGGIIEVLDPAGYGTATITKDITIDGSGGSIAGVLAAGTSGFTISGANAHVILRNLDIEGEGTGIIGVNFVSGATLAIEHCRIYGFQSGTARAISMAPQSGAKLMVSDTDIRDSGTGVHLETSTSQLLLATLDNVRIENMSQNALEAAGTGLVFAMAKHSTFNHNGGDAVNAGSATSTFSVVDSSLSLNNGAGANAAASGALIRVSGNAIFNNATGIAIAAGATVESDGTNRVGGFTATTPPNAPLLLQ